ncbi:hypothetical protein HN803_03120 [candidate division WWE3 bacterium]|jgi:hypothetical protein|nr:hypothetical protein [candidate division WWE3 bacterium]
MEKLYRNWFVHTFVNQPTTFAIYHVVKFGADERSAEKLKRKMLSLTDPNFTR